MTQIQKETLPLALSGKDILGAAKTGSGKTLAFLIPALDLLYKHQWTSMDGLGVLIISPTRELALQIFEVLRSIGKFHSFSAGLLIGGKDLKQEQSRVTKMNILVATPGRLLQHMDQTPDFYCDNLQMLILDEADGCLDCGFEKTLNAIIENLPKERQTLLFSATQTKSVKDLARLSLKDPEYVSVHEKDAHATPQKLSQKYTVVELNQKLDLLYSFLKTHLKSKMIVFVSSCKQVRFLHETFCKLQPGLVLMCLHGKQKQAKRMAIFEQFCRKQFACLFATDVAARGLDFPAVDWVVQVDCPEDADTYIHRVGRTARYESSGNALLFLLPSEENGMLQELENKKIPIESTKINPSKLMSIQKQLQAFCSQSPELKYLGQKSLISYVRSIYLHSNKNIFNVDALPLQEYAESLGLGGVPKISFVKKQNAKNRQQAALQEEITKSQSRTKVDKMFTKKNLTILSEHYAKLKDDESMDSADEEFLSVKRRDHDMDDIEMNEPKQLETPSHRQILKAKQKEMKTRGSAKKFHFDEDGNPLLAYQLESLDDFVKAKDIEERQQEYLEAKSSIMKGADALDKSLERSRIKERKKEKRKKERMKRQDESGEKTMVTLGSKESMDAFSDASQENPSSDEESVASMSSLQNPRKRSRQVDALNSNELEEMALSLLHE